MARSKTSSGIFVAKNTFACEINGEPYHVSKGERVREGHDLLRFNAEQFEPLESGAVRYDVEAPTPRTDVEDASATPGTKRNR